MSGNYHKDIIQTHFPGITPTQVEKLLALVPLYKEWNARINVVSRKDIESIFERHIFHSLFISKVINFRSGTEVLDLGTGGGLPGVPLAIIFPEVSFTLIDARAKKLKVVDHIADKLGIKNIRTKHVRAEDLKEKYDFVVSRAVASSEQLVKWSRPLIKKKQINPIPNGLLCLKGGRLDEELKPVKKQYYHELIPISDYYSEPYYAEKYILYIQLP